MKATIFWIEGSWRGKLGIGLRPRGADWLSDDVGAWRSAGADVIVSALQTHEVSHFALEQEDQSIRDQGMVFIGCPIEDRGVPGSVDRFADTLRLIATHLLDGKNVVVHCRQGIGRSGMIAAGVFVLEGIPLGDALSRIESARGLAVPETAEQRAWLFRLAQLGEAKV